MSTSRNIERPYSKSDSLSIAVKDLDDLKTAVQLLETIPLAVKISNVIGKPIEFLLTNLPDGAKETINGLCHSALQTAADAALWSLENKPNSTASNTLHKLAVIASGGVAGAFGLSALAVELPTTTTIMLRSIADIARSEGFDLSELDVKIACLEVFALGGPSAEDDATESGYYAVRLATTEAINKYLSKELLEIAAKNTATQTAKISTIQGIRSFTLTPAQAGSFASKIIEKIAARFNIVITEKVAAQAVPVIGAITGATLNTLFIDFYQNAAKGHFIVKRLEAKYGNSLIKEHYDEIHKKTAKIGIT